MTKKKTKKQTNDSELSDLQKMVEKDQEKYKPLPSTKEQVDSILKDAGISEIESKPAEDAMPMQMKSTTEKIKDRWLQMRKNKSLILVNMELRSGKFVSLLVDSAVPSYTYLEGEYIIDQDLMYYSATYNIYCLDYHQDFCMPVSRKIPIDAIRKAVDSLEYIDVEHGTNPMTLRRFMISKIAEGIMKGQEISDFLKSFRLLLYLTVIFSGLCLLILVQNSGVLASVGL